MPNDNLVSGRYRRPSMGNNSIFTTALKLLTLGYSVVPSGGGESGKAPTVNWTEYQQHQPDDTELEAWQQKLKPNL